MPKLAELFVEFVSQNADKLKAEIGEIGDGLEKADDKSKQFARTSETSTDKVKRAFKGVNSNLSEMQGLFGKIKGAAFSVFAGAGILASIHGFARAGLAGTGAMEQISLQMQFLSREIAQLFLPAINAIIDSLQAVVRWFRSLSGEQQNLIGRTTLIIAGFLSLSKILPVIITSVKALGAAFATASISSGVGAILPLIGVLTAIVASTDEGQRAFKQLWEALKPLGDIAQEVFGQMGELISEVSDILADSITDVMPEIVQVIKDLFDEIRPLIQDNANFMKDFLPQAVQLVSDLAKVLTPIVGVLLKIQMVIGQLALGSIVQTFQFLKPVIDFIVGAVNQFTPLLERIFSATAKIWKGFQRIGDIISRVFERFQNTNSNPMIRVLEVVVDLLARVIEQVAQFAEGVADAINTVAEVGGSIASFFGVSGRPRNRSRNSSSSSGGNRNTLQSSGGGFENVAATFNRLQSAALRSDHERQTAQNTQAMVTSIDAINTLLTEFLGWSTTPTPPTIAGS